MTATARGRACALLLASLLGCGRGPAAPAGTGAREAVRDYFDGLVRQDWRRAYDAVDPSSKKQLSLQGFTGLGQGYRRNLGFEPEGVQVQTCDENGGEATAHVVLTGRAAAHPRRYKDAVSVRRTAEGWRVVLPATFGRSGR